MLIELSYNNLLDFKISSTLKHVEISNGYFKSAFKSFSVIVLNQMMNSKVNKGHTDVMQGENPSVSCSVKSSLNPSGYGDQV